MEKHELWDGKTHKIADVPPGLLTHKIFKKIWDAFIAKGEPLTIDEVMPFYTQYQAIK